MSKFNNVYSVSVDVDQYLLLQTTVLDQILDKENDSIYVFDGVSKKDTWKKQSVEWMIISNDENDGLTEPDIAGWGSTMFAVPENIADTLKKQLNDCCEFLPIRLNEQTWFALHIIGKQNAMDPELTIINMRNGRPSRTRKFKQLVLKKSEIKVNGPFRVDGAGLTTYCTDEKGGFYDTVKKQGLLGLVFSKVTLS